MWYARHAMNGFQATIAFALTRLQINPEFDGTLGIWASTLEVCAGAARAQGIAPELWMNSNVVYESHPEDVGAFLPTSDVIIDAVEMTVCHVCPRMQSVPVVGLLATYTYIDSSNSQFCFETIVLLIPTDTHRSPQIAADRHR